MIAVVLLGLITMLLCWLEGNKYINYGLKLSFFLIFLFLSLRYDYGNDYKDYMLFFESSKNFNNISEYINSTKFEPAWGILNWVFKELNFFFLISFLALLNSITFYNIIKKYTDPEYYWFAIFIFIFNVGCLLTNLSTLRQNVAILFFIYSIKFIEQKKIIKFVLCIVLAAQFHSSAYILLLIYPLVFYKLEYNNYKKIIILIIYFSLFYYSSILLIEISKIVENNFDRYAVYTEGQDIKTGLGVVLSSFFLINIAYFLKIQNVELKIPFKIAMYSFFLIPLGLVLVMIGRLGLYFEPFLIIVFPNILSSCKSKLYSNFLLFSIIVFLIYNFYIFFKSPIFIEKYEIYQTIFSIYG
ncbi:EpsG family protein [Flavobacterium sp.]|uniref:EpsG family protein n=1 Tax=Flavobacterium sp. TaxID=239 RepID=UPI001B43416C|nr:EpsG family protein [Flavobacterium sp.]MBP6182583.1 EpsG family protein [Flavobacterium sp.]